jgi:hypothetical protein
MHGVPYGMGSKPKRGPNFGWTTQGPRINRQAKTQGFLRPTAIDVSPVSAPFSYSPIFVRSKMAGLSDPLACGVGLPSRLLAFRRASHGITWGYPIIPQLRPPGSSGPAEQSRHLANPGHHDGHSDGRSTTAPSRRARPGADPGHSRHEPDPDPYAPARARSRQVARDAIRSGGCWRSREDRASAFHRRQKRADAAQRSRWSQPSAASEFRAQGRRGSHAPSLRGTAWRSEARRDRPRARPGEKGRDGRPIIGARTDRSAFATARWWVGVLERLRLGGEVVRGPFRCRAYREWPNSRVADPNL